MTDSDASQAPDRASFVWDKQGDLMARCELSALYHGKRERFLGSMERTMQALTALAATSAFADIAGKPGSTIGKCLALIAAVSSILPLVFGFAERARAHGQLKANFQSILADMYGVGLELSEEQLSEFRSRVAKIEAGESSSLAALVIHCQNEIAVAREQPVFALSIWEKCFMHFYSFDAVAIYEREKAKLEKKNKSRVIEQNPSVSP
ncbi:MAG: hypothetical protein IV104_21725 [Acidovorax sp.]|nr:hypothetical protein [Acidovorax sp.]